MRSSLPNGRNRVPFRSAVQRNIFYKDDRMKSDQLAYWLVVALMIYLTIHLIIFIWR